MKLIEDDNELIIQETPSILWTLGLFFAIIGAIFVYGSLGGASNYNEMSFLVLATTFVFGSIAVAVGIWVIYRAPTTKVFVNKTENKVLIVRSGLFGKSETTYGFDEVKYFRLIEEKDDEGSPIWSLGMELLNNEVIKITSLPKHSEDDRKYIYMLNNFTQKQISSFQMILENEDENNLKMS